MMRCWAFRRRANFVNFYLYLIKDLFINYTCKCCFHSPASSGGQSRYICMYLYSIYFICPEQNSRPDGAQSSCVVLWIFDDKHRYGHVLFLASSQQHHITHHKDPSDTEKQTHFWVEKPCPSSRSLPFAVCWIFQSLLLSFFISKNIVEADWRTSSKGRSTVVQIFKQTILELFGAPLQKARTCPDVEWWCCMRKKPISITQHGHVRYKIICT